MVTGPSMEGWTNDPGWSVLELPSLLHPRLNELFQEMECAPIQPISVFARGWQGWCRRSHFLQRLVGHENYTRSCHCPISLTIHKLRYMDGEGERENGI